jgi:hypothetical protein
LAASFLLSQEIDARRAQFRLKTEKNLSVAVDIFTERAKNDTCLLLVNNF